MQEFAKQFGFILILAFALASCSKDDKRKIDETKEEVQKKVEEVGKELDTVGKKLDTLISGKDTIAGPKYVCILNPTKGNNVKGKLTIWQKGDDIYIEGEITGLAPGKHGFHVHEKGDCSAPDASSAGDHFNPTKKEHGKMSKDSHMGDLENVKADDKGVAKVDLELDADYWTLNEPNSIVGKSIVVHAAEDDLKTQPSGNSGPRLACGVIEKAK